MSPEDFKKLEERMLHLIAFLPEDRQTISVALFIKSAASGDNSGYGVSNARVVLLDFVERGIVKIVDKSIMRISKNF